MGPRAGTNGTLPVRAKAAECNMIEVTLEDLLGLSVHAVVDSIDALSPACPAHKVETPHEDEAANAFSVLSLKSLKMIGRWLTRQ